MDKFTVGDEVKINKHGVMEWGEGGNQLPMGTIAMVVGGSESFIKVKWGSKQNAYRPIQLELVEERETTTKETNPKDSVGSTKLSYSVIPMAALTGPALALMEGERKYGKGNWRAAGVRHSIYMDACIGHIIKFWEGQDIDPDSGLHEIDKAIAGLLVWRDSMLMGNDTDDRPIVSKGGQAMLRGGKDSDPLVEQLLKKYPECVPPYTQRTNHQE